MDQKEKGEEDAGHVPAALQTKSKDMDPMGHTGPSDLDAQDIGVGGDVAAIENQPTTTEEKVEKKDMPKSDREPDLGNGTDFMTLSQLKRVINEMPRIEPKTEPYKYDEAVSFQREMEDWFSYTEEDQSILHRARSAFEETWTSSASTTGTRWRTAGAAPRKQFVQKQVDGLGASDGRDRLVALRCLLYVVLGAWGELGGQNDAAEESAAANVADAVKQARRDTDASIVFAQMTVMMKVAVWIEECGGLQPLHDIMRAICFPEWNGAPAIMNAWQEGVQDEILQVVMTLFYVVIETGRDQILLLFWKSVLLLFGGTKELKVVKQATREELDRTPEDDSKTLITASPLDYHLFRQEITSKYPAYDPPPPLVPLEAENNSLLPPLASHPSRQRAHATRTGVGPANINSNGSSMLQQPVHIATPAPSPPPSPAGPGGKGSKKHNYQTNQNFPFLYPPPDSAAAPLGGARQAASKRREWESHDVPASILEAGELFAQRMRMTRALRQLWEERERYMRFERGWTDDADITHSRIPTPGKDGQPRKAFDPDVTKRLDMVEAFYKGALPHLQSLVIVMLKVILSNVTALFTQPTANGNGQAPNPDPNRPPNADQSSSVDHAQAGHRENYARQTENGVDGEAKMDEAAILTLDEIVAARERDVIAKGVSGSLMLLLKWFKVSHVLKFEFLTQLLLDSNYLPLILKLFAHQDVEKAIDGSTEREEFKYDLIFRRGSGLTAALSFFSFCQEDCWHPFQGRMVEAREADEACPSPNIGRFREDVHLAPAPSAAAADGLPADQRPARPPPLHERGWPTSSSPFERYSWRNFTPSITFLRIMQKICKNKAHRNLLLVQYKSSTILKKALKIPQPDLRLCTLKLFKNQVPYCGRKWRQTNMRVITAIYLNCRPEFRDDWLAGSDVDAEVEEALPLEQALRALTHWHNLKRYPDEMGADPGVLKAEQDFFVRELERMDGGGSAAAAEDLHGEAGWDGPVPIDAW
ncbi:MAG: Factor arrest protein 11 [Phylliscum demangeonii]|nr:MAG: Factor arrest protein 11 [Phylliscum demangeonii]